MINFKNKRGFEMSFSMIFSIIAGGIILFLAIYGTVRFINIGQQTTYTEAAKSIDNYLGNLATGIAEGVSTKISFRKETRILFDCLPSDINSPFGKQTIGFSEESGIGQKWYNSTTKITRKNKYVFANNTEQGKKMFIFIKPFYMGFKVDDLIIMSASNYCFIRNGMPNWVIADIENLQMDNVKIADTCGGTGNITVCFGYGCSGDIIVKNIPTNCAGGCEEYEVGSVEKNGASVDYVGNLLYGAIFSSKDVYSCNVGRLGKKTATLAELYSKKIGVVSSKNCNSVIGSDLQILNLGFAETTIIDQYQVAKSMDADNSVANCKIYPGEDYGNI